MTLILGDIPYQGISPNSSTAVQTWDKDYPIKDDAGSPNAVIVQIRLGNPLGKSVVSIATDSYGTSSYYRWQIIFPLFGYCESPLLLQAENLMFFQTTNL